MAVRKIRRDGNSLVVTIPVEEAAKAHLAAGDYVQVEADKATGELRILPVRPSRRPDFLRIGHQVIRENRTLLDRLAQ